MWITAYGTMVAWRKRKDNRDFAQIIQMLCFFGVLLSLSHDMKTPVSAIKRVRVFLIAD